MYIFYNKKDKLLFKLFILTYTSKKYIIPTTCLPLFQIITLPLLLDSASQYIGKLFKSMLTVLVQILCCKMGLLLVFSGQLIYAIAMIILAIKTPKMLQEFMLGGGGGGISNVIITASKTMELSGQLSRKLKQLKKVKW